MSHLNGKCGKINFILPSLLQNSVSFAEALAVFRLLACKTAFFSGCTFKTGVLQVPLPITSIFLTITGIIGNRIIHNQLQIFAENPDSSNIKLALIFQSTFPLLSVIGVFLAFISLYIKKSKLALIAGIIPCVYSIIMIFINIITWVNFDI